MILYLYLMLMGTLFWQPSLLAKSFSEQNKWAYVQEPAAFVRTIRLIFTIDDAPVWWAKAVEIQEVGRLACGAQVAEAKNGEGQHRSFQR